jgi:hypothetical protein
LVRHKTLETDTGGDGKQHSYIHDISRIEHELEYDESFSDGEHMFREQHLNFLNFLKDELENICFNPDDAEQQCRVHHCLALLYTKLGDYTKADRHYGAAIPYVYFEPDDLAMHDMDRFCTKLINGFREYHLKVLLHYFEFAIETGQNLDVTERILGILPWLVTLAGRGSLNDAETRKITLLTVQASNARLDTEEAFKHLCKCNMGIHSVDTLSVVALEKAKVYASKDPTIFRGRSRNAFIYSITTSTILSGIWHENTLKGLRHFGTALMSWGDQEAACRVLEECCLGTCYRYGWNHPYSIKARGELEKCEGSASALQTVLRFEALENGEERSVAYEHVFVNTIIDLLCHVPGFSPAGLRDALIRTKMVTEVHPCADAAHSLDVKKTFETSGPLWKH